MTGPKFPPLFGGVNTAMIGIAAPADAVWSILFDRARWINGFVSKLHLDGLDSAVGERAVFTSTAPDGTPTSRIEEILISEPPRRLVTRLALAATDATFAFAEWRLTATAGGTQLEMNLYWTDLPEPGADWAAITEQRRGYLDHTQATLDSLVAAIARAAIAGPAAQ